MCLVLTAERLSVGPAVWGEVMKLLHYPSLVAGARHGDIPSRQEKEGNEPWREYGKNQEQTEGLALSALV